MKIKNVSIKNFRGIENLDAPVEFGALNFFIGDNGTGKTTLLEAVNFCLSSGYVASRLDVNDFHDGGSELIEIVVEFQDNFVVKIPDGYGDQKIDCNKIRLAAKKRDRAAPGKAFSDLVTTTHHFVPVEQRSDKGWSIMRASGTKFEFDERRLSLSNTESSIPRVFYFSKTRVRQLTKGFNSSFSSIIDDLNWRFDRGQRQNSADDHFKHERKALHDKVFAGTDGDTLKKTIDAANKTLSELDVPEIEVSLFKTLTPYDHSEVVFPFDGFELPVGLSGSGIEMVLSLALLEAMATLSKEKIVILIDEPELHLHPKLQSKLVEHLTKLSDKVQIVASTHSPFLFQNIYRNSNAKLQVTKRIERRINIADAHELGFGYLGWSPSWGEICYLAYDLPTTEFHNDLYGSLEEKFNRGTSGNTRQADFDNWLVGQGHHKEIKWTNAQGASTDESLMTYVRNRIHHPENAHRPEYTNEQLRKSIELMCKLIRP
jgi:predicted ATP-dependent endonuclease of OLD family